MELRKLIPVFAILAVFAMYSPCADAGSSKGMGKTTTVTGCLQKAAQPNQYQLVANGKTYILQSSGNVNFADHVGHKVSVTGTYVKAEAATGTNTTTGTTEKEINVTHLKHISTTCQP